MSTLKITVHAPPGTNSAGVAKAIRKALAQYAIKIADSDVQVEREKQATSRADRFSQAQSDLGNAKSEAESLKDELESWHDNLPENLQDGNKANELQEAIDNLQEFVDACETAEGIDVSFPGMFG